MKPLAATLWFLAAMAVAIWLRAGFVLLACVILLGYAAVDRG